MFSFQAATAAITGAKDDVRHSIGAEEVAWLLDTSACARCAAFLSAHSAPDARERDHEQERLAAGQLLLILAAMEGESEHDTLEVLRLMGTRSVDTRGKHRVDRHRLAGEARRRPIADPRHYKRFGHLARAEQRLSSELHALVTRPKRLEAALAANGAEAVARYL